MHKIDLEDNIKPLREAKRIPNPIMQDVLKTK